jgi:hypothetical protein
VILDTKGNIFGGFTPVEWDFNSGWKADDSLKSFVFTLKNPHNIPARKFALRAEMKHQAICCNATLGPCFGGVPGCDIAVSRDCNRDNMNWTDLDAVYTNDTGLGRKIVFTGSKHFQAKEIEVFEITA